MTINHNDLKEWSIAAADALKEIIDNAQSATDEPYGDSECVDLRNLLAQHEVIISGGELWQKKLLELSKDDTEQEAKIAKMLDSICGPTAYHETNSR